MSSLIKTIKLKEYSDDRGSLVENTLEDVMKKSKHFFVSKTKPGVIRANHYHQRKSEWFYLIQGKCLLKVKDLDSGKIEELKISDKQNILVNMPKNFVHTFKNVGDNEMILLALVNEVHKQDDPDTHFCKLM
jgi:UDP-2-acetamido-2,6-beta-L-arabino-hexul-4-ose reductase